MNSKSDILIVTY